MVHHPRITILFGEVPIFSASMPCFFLVESFGSLNLPTEASLSWPRSDHGHVEDELDIIPLLRTTTATAGIGFLGPNG